MKYEVGEIFYLVGSENIKIIPFRVVEEITRTTLEGVEKSYIVELPDKANTRVDVSRLKGNIFKDLHSLKLYMIDNASKAIEGMAFNAMQISEKVFKVDAIRKLAEDIISKEKSTLPLNESINVQNKNKEDIIKVDIGNGVIANMKATELEKVNSNL